MRGSGGYLSSSVGSYLQTGRIVRVIKYTVVAYQCADRVRSTAATIRPRIANGKLVEAFVHFLSEYTKQRFSGNFEVKHFLGNVCFVCVITDH